MPGRAPAQNLSLSITNPLILYRALIATRKIRPDPAQHRLALQLQKLYFRLKDYAPEVEYRYRLERIGRSVSRKQNPGSEGERNNGTAQRNPNTSENYGTNERAKTKKGVLSSLLSINSLSSSTLALTRTIPLHDSALAIDSPMGMLLYGEVGRGKSMLLDLLYNSLPSRKKRRWHFNTFMLDIFRRIEHGRIERLGTSGFTDVRRSLFGGPSISDHEHVVLTMAKDTISDSPILFLDEFQMPDRTSSKLINGFFTAFFHLGGVLVASSNRMPEELSKAAGIEFGDMQRNSGRASGGHWGLGWGLSRASEGEKAAKTDFGLFLDVLRARCEVWEMEGERDWRREGDEAPGVDPLHDENEVLLEESAEQIPIVRTTTEVKETSSSLSSDSPAHYHIDLLSSPDSSSLDNDIQTLNSSDTWQPMTLTVYARNIHLSQTHHGILKASFRDLCASYLGPADYVSLCSTFHTLILTAVPVLTLTQKNEARRFITLLDALYEAKCRLLIQAEAPPDKLFFPETRLRSTTTATSANGRFLSETLIDESGDSITSEAFSEMYQDSTAPFRPNISIYTESAIRSSTPPSFTPSLSNPSLRTVLADEDADFGPTYGNGRGHGISDSSTVVHEMTAGGPDFTSTSVLTGEDERFAYKRARSRLWEMCGRKWWDERLPVPDASEETAAPEWWRPVHRDGRFWESTAAKKDAFASSAISQTPSTPDAPAPAQTNKPDFNPRMDGMFRHNASPFRRSSDPPPKFSWQHAWGMMQWGKKAGEWGKGVEGRKPREVREDERDDDSGRER
ncbi:hypothetical protein H2200_006201 [Cladophialophora chaetospira]|uniref:AAA+ ATPase domain-containing protein n=1 Tax=Cladophialophora chaetospira TaxID=386627 RepID=A0AA38XAG8_9EURO|nr:hypothetical protein H2200_006201 [Cladophialophora chaetospira]